MTPPPGPEAAGFDPQALHSLDEPVRRYLAHALLPGLVHRPGARLTTVLAHPLPVYLGRISYELYLWHYVIITLVFVSTEIPVVETAWWTLPLSIGLAAASHALLSPQIDRWKARLPY